MRPGRGSIRNQLSLDSPIPVGRVLRSICYDAVVSERSLEMIEAIVAAGRRQPGLALLMIFGSQARGDARAGSDWDFGYLGEIDADGLMLDLVNALGTDRIDLVDLARASGLLRYRAARDGQPVLEGVPGAHARFWLEAVDFWCDAQPLLMAGYDDVLTALDR
jgi:predicted nucleotidyltransferase